METKPLVDALVDFFEEVDQRRFEQRVWLALDALIRGAEAD